MELINTALFLAAVLLLSLTVKLINSKHHRREGGREAPGPWNLPFLGSLHHFLGKRLLHRAFRDLSAVHGPVLRLKLGEINAIIISSAEAAKEITMTHDNIFASRPINNTVNALFYGRNNIIHSPYGELWRQMRRICTLELLSAKRVRSFRAVREEEVSRLVRSIATSSGSAINFSNGIAEISSNIMARATVCGRCCDQKLFISILNEVEELTAGFSVADLFPSLPFIGHITGRRRRLDQCRMRLDQMAEDNIRKHAKKIAKLSIKDDDDEKLMEEDFTDVILRIQQEGNLSFPLSNDNVKAVINDMLLAGSETTATTMEWIMSELIRNPSIMKKAQKEVREAIGSINTLEKLVEEEILRGKLTYLQMVIKETFRLHPPAPLLLPRENQESYMIAGYEIPAKTTVVINMWAIARDVKYWEDPDIFWPERFDQSSLDFRGTHFEFIPFGAGRRICPGMQFGLATVEIVLAYLLYYFDWEHLGKELDMTEAFGVTVRRESPLCLVPTLHFPLPSSSA